MCFYDLFYKLGNESTEMLISLTKATSLCHLVKYFLFCHLKVSSYLFDSL